MTPETEGETANLMRRTIQTSSEMNGKVQETSWEWTPHPWCVVPNHCSQPQDNLKPWVEPHLRDPESSSAPFPPPPAIEVGEGTLSSSPEPEEPGAYQKPLYSTASPCKAPHGSRALQSTILPTKAPQGQGPPGQEGLTLNQRRPWTRVWIYFQGPLLRDSKGWV